MDKTNRRTILRYRYDWLPEQDSQCVLCGVGFYKKELCPRCKHKLFSLPLKEVKAAKLKAFAEGNRKAGHLLHMLYKAIRDRRDNE